jgi:hypothetical protein
MWKFQNHIHKLNLVKIIEHLFTPGIHRKPDTEGNLPTIRKISTFSTTLSHRQWTKGSYGIPITVSAAMSLKSVELNLES